MLSLLRAVSECMGAVDGADAADAQAAAELGLGVLEGLASTRRFSMLLMFLDKKQTAQIKEVFAEVRRLGAAPPESLAKAWGVA